MPCIYGKMETGTMGRWKKKDTSLSSGTTKIDYSIVFSRRQNEFIETVFDKIAKFQIIP